MCIPIWLIVTLVTLIFIYLVIAQYQLFQVIKRLWMWLRMRVTAIYKAAAKVLKPIWIWLNIYGYSFWKRWYVPILTLIAFGVFGVAIYYYLKDIAETVHNLVGQLVVLSSQKVTPPSPDSPSGKDLSTVLKNLAQGSALLLGALVAAATLFFTLIKTWINERTTTAEEEGLITDRINAAVASLGAEKTIKKGKDEQTVPNIEVRIGAILALERMAKKTADVHIQIMEILTAYIRENAPVTEEEHDRKPRHDIQLAFTVIGRRPEESIALERINNFRLDLRKCDLTRIVIHGVNFDCARFDDSIFNSAILIVTSMQSSYLNRVSMRSAYLSNVNFNKVKFFETVSLEFSCVRKCNLSDSGISQDQINVVFGDGSVTLPDSITWPSHWPKKELNDDEFYTKWEEWKKTLPPDGA